MKSIVLFLAVTLSFMSASYAQPDLKMVCNLNTVDTSGAQTNEFLETKMFSTKDEPLVEVFGEKGRVALGYERYGAIITISSKGFVVVLMDGSKSIGSQVIPYSQPEFSLDRKIDNLKFDKLSLECGQALGKAD
jgi:hypothetical protein